MPPHAEPIQEVDRLSDRDGHGNSGVVWVLAFNNAHDAASSF